MSTSRKKPYVPPVFTVIGMDKNIRLVMLSAPPGGPGEGTEKPDNSRKEDPFSTTFDD